MTRFLKLNVDDTVSLFCEYEDRDRAKAFGDYRWDNRSKCWVYPFNIKKIDLMKRGFPDLRLDEAIVTRVAEETAKLERLEKIKAMKDVNLDDIDYKFRSKPYPHQKVGFKWLLEIGSGLLLDEMGLGKSAEALYYGEYLKQHGKIDSMVVFCPKSIKEKWAEEVEKHTRLVPVVVEGNREQRERRLSRLGHVYIMNYEAATSFPDRIRAMADKQMVIVDEIHFAKNPKTQIAKLMKELTPRYKVGLTGTVAHNGMHDVYNPIQFIKTYWRNHWAFSDRYVRYGGFQNQQIIGYKNVDELKSILDSVSIRRLANEVLDLPEYTYETRLMEMEKEQLRAYGKMKEEMILAWRDVSEEELRVRYSEVAAQLVRLEQIADGYLSDGVKQQWLPDNAKEQELDTILEDVIGASGKKCVVWSQFVYPVKYLYEKYKKKYGAVRMWGDTKEEDRNRFVKKLNTDPNTKLFIAQMSTGGIGFDLIGARVEVFYKLDWNESNNQQAEKRLIRVGQTGTVSIIKLIVKDTIDERIRKVSLKKGLEAADLQKDIPKLDKARLMEILS